MYKLVQAYIAKPTTENARKLVNYVKKHPMATCFASSVELDVLKNAQSKIAGEVK